MTIRREPTYLSTEVWLSLRLLTKRAGRRTDAQGFEQIATVDELADHLLADAIKEKYPEILDYMKRAKKMEDDFIKGNSK